MPQATTGYHARQDPDGVELVPFERHILHYPADVPAILQSHTCLGVLPSHSPISRQRLRDETIQSKLLFSLSSTSFSHPSAQVVVGHQGHHTCEECRLVSSR